MSLHTLAILALVALLIGGWTYSILGWGGFQGASDLSTSRCDPLVRDLDQPRPEATRVLERCAASFAIASSSPAWPRSRVLSSAGTIDFAYPSGATIFVQTTDPSRVDLSFNVQRAATSSRTTLLVSLLKTTSSLPTVIRAFTLTNAIAYSWSSSLPSRFASGTLALLDTGRHSLLDSFIELPLGIAIVRGDALSPGLYAFIASLRIEPSLQAPNPLHELSP